MTATVGHDRRFYIPEGAGRVKGADVVTVASQDPSGAIATPPTWALWPFRWRAGAVASIPMGGVMVVQGVRASDKVVGQAMSTQMSAPG